MEVSLINGWPEFDSMKQKAALICQRAFELDANPALDLHLRGKLADTARRLVDRSEGDLAYAALLTDQQALKQFRFELIRDYEVELWCVIARR